MLKLQLGGGLGNQMFQYAYLYSQLKEKGLEDKKILFIMHHNIYEDVRSFALSNLNLSLDYKIVDEKNCGFKVKLKRCEEKAIKKFCRSFKITGKHEIKLLHFMNIVSVSELYEYFDTLVVKNKNSFIEGAFQNWRYFDHYRKDIINEYKICIPIAEHHNKLLKKISESNSVCVHIRRGDYTNSHYKNTLSICDLNYYQRAMDYIARKTKTPIFYVFSNTHEDHEWIKENYKFKYPTVYMDFDNSDYEELRLMGSCKHFIISNSSFSWWAQYLSANDTKIVVAPSKWFNGPVNAAGIYMPGWKLIDV